MNPAIIDKNIKILKQELSYLSDEKPILIAMGVDTYNILKKNMDGYDLHKIRHYSANGSQEYYKNKVWKVLKTI